MSEAYPLTLFILTGVIWCLTSIQAHRLFYRFRTRHPDIARQEIPFAFEFTAHPEKLFYFFKSKSKDILKADPPIWALRQQVKVLLILSGAISFGGFAVLVGIVLNSISVHQ
jgi:hypothetical protein